jgi:hypothetical protein
MANRPMGDEQAKLDELGNDPGQVGPDSAGQSGDPQRLSGIEDAVNESVQELANTDQAIEAGIVEGVEDAADHPERPVHTHLEYGRPDDVPPLDEPGDVADPLTDDQIGGVHRLGANARDFEDIDVEDLPDSKEGREAA